MNLYVIKYSDFTLAVEGDTSKIEFYRNYKQANIRRAEIEIKAYAGEEVIFDNEIYVLEFTNVDELVEELNKLNNKLGKIIQL
jgi:hypothetical protein